jgi:hypothetical protein
MRIAITTGEKPRCRIERSAVSTAWKKDVPGGNFSRRRS